jgi:phage-related protein
MGISGDSIEVSIESSASRAASELDKLIAKLGQVGSSIQSIGDVGKLSGSMGAFAASMKEMSSVKATDFNRFATGLEKIGKVDASKIQSAANSIGAIGNATRKMASLSENAVQIGELAKNISRLGYKGATNAIDNMPKLAAALNTMMASLSKAPRVSNNLIQMTNALAMLSKQGYGLKGTANALMSVNNRLKSYSSTASRATNNTISLAASFGKLYAVAYTVIRGFKSLGKAITNSMDYIESYNYFNVITDKIGSEFSGAWKENGFNNAQDYASSFKERLNNLTSQMTGFSIGNEGGLYLSDSIGLGLDPEAIVSYQAQISSITNAAKLAGETSIAASKGLTMLAADFSSLANMDLKDVMENFRSGLVGQSEALYKYGIDITDATLKQYALANGIKKSTSEMSQGEKMQLRLLAILDQSKVAYGDLANTLSGVSNQYRMLKQQVANLSRIIGNLFIPMLQAVLPYLNGVVIALQRFFTWIGNLMGIKWDNLMDGISNGYTDTGLEALNQDADNVTDALEDASKAASKLKKTIHSYDEIHVATDNTKDDTSIGGSGGIDLSGAIADALADYESAWNDALSKMENKAGEIADRISSFFKGIWTAIEPFRAALQNLWDNGLSKLGNFSWTALKDFYDGFLQPLGEWAFGTAGEGLTRLVDVFNSFLEKINWSELNRSLKEFWVAIEPYAEQFGEGLIDFFEDILGIGGDLINKIPGFLDGITAALNNGDPAKARDWGYALGVLAAGIMAFKGIAAIVSVIQGVVTAISSVVTPIMTFGANVIGVIEIMAGGFGTLGEAISMVFGPVAATLSGVFAIIGGLALAVTNFADMFQEGFSVVKEILMVLGIALAAVGAVILGAPAAIAAAVAGIVAAVATLAVVIKENWDSISAFFAGIPEFFGGIWESVKNFCIDAWNALLDFLGGLPEKIGKIIEDIANWFSELPGKLGYALGYALGTVTKWAIDLAEYLGEKIPEIIENVRTWFSELPDKIYNAIVSFIEKAKQWAADVKKTFEEKTKEIINNVVNFFKELPGNIYNAIKGFFEKIKQWAKEAVSTVRSTVPEIISTIVNFFTSLPGKLFDIGKQMIQGLINGVQSMFSSAWSAISSFADGVVSGFKSALQIHSPSRVMFALGEFTIEGYENGLKNLFGDVYSTLGKFSEKIQSSVDVDASVILPNSLDKEYTLNTGEAFVAREAERRSFTTARIGAVNTGGVVGSASSEIRRAVTEAMMDVFMATSGNTGKQNSDRPIQLILDGRIIAESTYAEFEDMAARGLMPGIV